MKPGRSIENVACDPSWRRRCVFLLSGVLIVFLSGCASMGVYNPATERREFIFIPTQQEVSMGLDYHGKILEEYSLSGNRAKTQRVERIGQALALVSDRQDYEYKFYLIDKKELNAFTTPGGHIYIHEGLLDKLPSDAEVSAVLAHEMGHCAAKHVVKKFQAAVGYDLLGRALLSAFSDNPSTQKIANLSMNSVMGIVFKSYSRNDEYQADRLALKYMDLAGYDLQGIIKVFELLEAASKGDKIPLILRTHPYLDDRIVAVRARINEMRAGSGPDSLP